MQALGIIALSIVCCVAYGIVHDQITARICVEYFTIGHPPIFPTQDPTLLGIGWGVIATWWVGAILGIPLAIASRIGNASPVGVSQLIRPMLTLMFSCGMFAALAGLVGFLAARNGYVFLVGDLAGRVPVEKHVAFLTALWAHSASYLGGIVGGVILIAKTWRARHSRHRSHT